MVHITGPGHCGPAPVAHVYLEGKRTEDSWHSYQVPMGEMHDNPAHVRVLEEWMKSYKPHERFDQDGRLNSELADLARKGDGRMSVNPHTNGGLLLKDLHLPDFRDYAVTVPSPGAAAAEATRIHARERLFDPSGNIGADSRKFLEDWMDRYVTWVNKPAG